MILGRPESPYIPKARPKSDEPAFWGKLRQDGLQNSIELLEVDVFYRAVDVVKKFLDGRDMLEIWKKMAEDSKFSAQAV